MSSENTPDETIDPVTSAPEPGLFERVRARTVFALLLVAMLGVMVIGALARGWRAGWRMPEFMAGTYAVFFVVIVFYLLAHRADLRRLAGPLDLSGTGYLIITSVLVNIVFTTGATWLQERVFKFFHIHYLEDADWLAGVKPGSAQYIILLATVVLIAPVVEELFFRGFLLHRWGRKWGVTTGVLLSSILFGLMHPQVLGGAGFAVTMCLLYIRTQRLLVPIVAHMSNNAIAAAVAIATKQTGTDTIISAAMDGWWGAAALLTSVPLVWLLLSNLLPRNTPVLPFDRAVVPL